MLILSSNVLPKRFLLPVGVGLLLAVASGSPPQASNTRDTVTDAIISYYDFAIRLNPDDAFAVYNRGLVYREVGDIERAASDLKRAYELGIHGAGEILRELGIDP